MGSDDDDMHRGIPMRRSRAGAQFEDGSGDLFASGCEVLVNPVNCVGVMGKGLAKTFKDRVPGLESAYKAQLAAGTLRIGTVAPFVSEALGVVVINFPTKRHWRAPARLEDIESGLADLAAFLRRSTHTTLAMPAIGCGLGGLDWDAVRPVIISHLREVDGLAVTLYPPASEKGGS